METLVRLYCCAKSIQPLFCHFTAVLRAQNFNETGSFRLYIETEEKWEKLFRVLKRSVLQSNRTSRISLGEIIYELIIGDYLEDAFSLFASAASDRYVIFLASGTVVNGRKSTYLYFKNGLLPEEATLFEERVSTRLLALPPIRCRSLNKMFNEVHGVPEGGVIGNAGVLNLIRVSCHYRSHKGLKHIYHLLRRPENKVTVFGVPLKISLHQQLVANRDPTLANTANPLIRALENVQHWAARALVKEYLRLLLEPPVRMFV